MTLFIPLANSSAWDHNELRFALRSWEKFGNIDDLLIIGHKPAWLKNAQHIQFVEYNSKPRNIYDKIKIAAETYDKFIYANDDHFLLKPLINLPYYYQCKLKDYRNGGETFMRYVANTRALFPEGLYFDVHTPIVVHSEIVKSLKYEKDVLFKSLYCNTAKVEGVKAEDIKIRAHIRREEIDNIVRGGHPFLSTGNAISHDLRQWFFETYPEKSSFEV